MLTYKLFSGMLDAKLVGPTPELVRLPLVYDPDESEKRELFMSPSLAMSLMQKDPRKAMNYAANVRAYIGRFVKGGSVDNSDYMKCWCDDVFELRVQNQRKKERLRIFGGFGRPDTFIAFFAKPRGWFGGKDDPRWDLATSRVVDEWSVMFPGCRRVPARPFSNCVTFNAYDVHV